MSVIKDCTVMLTCCGGLVSPGLIRCLKLVNERKIRVIGVDAKESAVGSFLVDRFYTVPPGDSPDYVNAIKDISAREGVVVVLPASDEESLALSEHRHVFEEKGIKIATSDSEMLKIAYNKGNCYRFFREKRLPCPEFFIVRTSDEFEGAAAKLGYPTRPVVMKPSRGRGGRGVKILTPSGAKESMLKERTGDFEANYKVVLETLKAGNFPEVILMEFLPGEEYSVDALVKQGRPLITVPKLRLDTSFGPSLVGMVKKNLEVEKLVTDICQAFNFNYNINIQLKYSYDQKALPSEINPRVAGTLALAAAAGANLLYYAVKLALGEEIPEAAIKDGVRMIRYYQELFISRDRVFDLEQCLR